VDRELKLKIIFDALDKMSGPMKRITEGSKQMRAAMAESRAQLKQMQAQAGNIAGFRKLKTSLSETEQKWKAAERRAAELARQMRGVDQPTKAMSREFNKAAREAAKLKQEHTEQAAKLQALRGRLSDAGISTRNLSEHERQLRQDMTRTTREIEEQRAQIERLNQIRRQSENLQNLGSQMTSAGQENVIEGSSILAPFILATKGAMDFSSGMVDLQQKAGLTNAELVKMRDQIIAASRATHQLPEDMRAAVDVLAGFGLDPRQAVQLAEPIGRLGTAFKVELADGAAAAYANLNNLKVPLSETARAFDIMAAGSNAGAFEIKDMARWFPTLTARMQVLGQTGVPAVTDLTAALQVAMKTAGSADEAANNISNLMAKINAPATIRAFQKNFGIDLPAALRKFEAQGMTTMEAFATIADKATGGDDRKLGFVLEDQQAQLGLIALIQNMEEYRKIRSDIANSGGTIDAAFDQRQLNDGLIAWQTFKVQLASTALVLGTKLLPVASEFLGIAARMANAVGEFAAANPELTTALLYLVAGAGALKVVLGSLQMIFGGLIGTVGRLWPLIAPLASMFSGLFSALAGSSVVGGLVNGLIALTGPIGWLVAGIAVAATLIYVYWDEIKAAFSTAIDWLGGAWEWLKNTFMTAPAIFGPLGLVAALLYGIFSGIGTFVASAFQSFWQATQPLRESLVGLFSALGALGAAILGWIGRIAGPWFEWLGGMGSAVLSFIGAAIQPFLSLMASIGSVIAGAITVALEWINQLVGSAAMAAWEAWGSTVGSFIGGVVGKLKGFVDWITSGISAITEFFNAAGQEPKAASGKGRGGAAAPSTPKIAGKRALGGPVLARRLYLVGENGPEFFEAPMSGRIIPNYKLGNMTSPRGSRGLAMAGALAAAPMAAAAQPAPPPMPNIQALEVASSITAPAPPAMPTLDALTAMSTVAPPSPPPMPALDALSIVSSIAAPPPPAMPALNALTAMSTVAPPSPPPMPALDALSIVSSIAAPPPPAMPALNALTAMSTVAPPSPPPMPALDALSIMTKIAAPSLPPMPTLDALRMAMIVEPPAIPPAPQFAPLRAPGAIRDQGDAPAMRSSAAPPSSITINITIQQQPGEDGEQLARRVAELIDRRTNSSRLGAYRDE
jgi:TP901 family phage tail tape measure protein